MPRRLQRHKPCRSFNDFYQTVEFFYCRGINRLGLMWAFRMTTANYLYLVIEVVENYQRIGKHKKHIGESQIIGVFLRQIFIKSYRIITHVANQAAEKPRQ